MEIHSCFWSTWTPQRYLYCEAQLCGWLQQPANTWSNIGYLLVAILILRSKQRRLEKTFFFWTTFLLFLGSTFFHLSGTHLGKMLDVGAMLALSMGICALSVQRYFYWDLRKTFILFFGGLSGSWIFLTIFDIGYIPFSLEVLVAAILEYRMIREDRGKLLGKTLLLAIFSEFLAGIALVSDLTRSWCDPDNHIINGHAVWHLISAAAIYFLFKAIKSEA